MWLQSEEGDQVAISVSDNGPGLPPDVYEECMKDLVFEKKEHENCSCVKRVSEDDFEDWEGDFLPGQMWLQGYLGGKRW